MKSLRLMTYNVHRCVGADRKLDVALKGRLSGSAFNVQSFEWRGKPQ